MSNETHVTTDPNLNSEPGVTYGAEALKGHSVVDMSMYTTTPAPMSGSISATVSEDGLVFESQASMPRTAFNASTKDLVTFSDGSKTTIESAIATGLLIKSDQGYRLAQVQVPAQVSPEVNADSAQQSLEEPEQSITTPELNPSTPSEFSNTVINEQLDAMQETLGAETFDNFIDKVVNGGAGDYMVRQADVPSEYAETVVEQVRTNALRDGLEYVEARGVNSDDFVNYLKDHHDQEGVTSAITKFFKTRNAGHLNKYLREMS